MKRKLLLVASLLVAGITAQAQRVNCGLTLAKSGTGLNRTYTLGSTTTVPASALSLRIYPSAGVTQSGTGTTRTATYTYGGVYTLYLDAANYCNDSVFKTDTIVGPMNCAATSTTLSATTSGATATFTNTVVGTLAPNYYVSTVVYSYGDGISGTSATHTYPAFGSTHTFQVRAVTTLTHPTYGSCTDTAYTTVSIYWPSCGATFTKSGTGLSRTYSLLPANQGNTTYYIYVDGNNYGNVSTFNHTYSQPGIYPILAAVQGPTCQDTFRILDTIAGQVNCASLTHTISASGTGASRTFSRSGAAAGTFPGYTRTVNYTYGDGTSGTVDYHTYTTSGTYLVTAITTQTHPTYGTCSVTDTVSVAATVTAPFNCANVHAAYTYTASGTAYTFTNTSTNTNTGTSSVTYSWQLGSSSGPWTNLPGSATTLYQNFPAGGTYCIRLAATWTGGGVVCQDNYTQCFTVTVPPALNRIYANATWDSSLNAAGASVKFWLIKYDSTNQLLTAIDSALVAVQGGFSTGTTFNNKPAGSYRVKAHMLNQPVAWTTHLLPTYSSSAAYWQYATVLNHTGATTYGNVFLQQGAATTGPGFIGGLVTQGANKGAAYGDPMVNKMIILRDQYGTPLATTLTNGQGRYSFANLPYGTYTVYPEELNYTTTPSQAITLSATQPSASGYNFRQELVARTFDPYFNPTAVSNTTAATGIEAFPNPAQHTLFVRLAGAATTGPLQLFNLTGQVVKAQVVDAAQPLQAIGTEGLASGTYLLHIPTSEGRQVFKVNIQQ